MSFRLMSNIIDIALAAGECAEAMRSDFGLDLEAAASATLLVERVKLFRRSVEDGRLDETHRTSGHTREEWAALHAEALAEGFAVYARLREISAVSLGNRHAEPLSRLALRISDGYRLKGLPQGIDKLAA
jgi:hypothetical protein